MPTLGPAVPVDAPAVLEDGVLELGDSAFHEVDQPDVPAEELLTAAADKAKPIRQLAGAVVEVHRDQLLGAEPGAELRHLVHEEVARILHRRGGEAERHHQDVEHGNRSEAAEHPVLGRDVEQSGHVFSSLMRQYKTRENK